MSALDRVTEAVGLSHVDDEPVADRLLVALAEATISAEQREKWRKQGVSLSDGSFPIPNAAFLRKAMQSFGRCPPEKRAALKALIKRRAKDLGVDISDSAIVAAADPQLVLALAAADDSENGGDGEDGEAGGLDDAQRKLYDKMRKRGMPHKMAMAAAKRVGS